MIGIVMKLVSRMALSCAALTAFTLIPPQASGADVPLASVQPKALSITLINTVTSITNADPVLGIKITNVEKYPVRFFWYTFPFDFDLIVTDAGGRLVGPQHAQSVGGIAAKPGPEILSAGATLNYDGMTYALTDWGYTLPAGTYTIQASARFASIKSNTIKITIHS